MAKWGEGDDRWIVEHREDGRNINGWHWEEKNMLTWVKQRVEDIVKSDESWSLKLPDASAKISSVKEIKGEASVSKRKGTKLFAMYDLAVTLKWSGSDDGKEVAGEVKVTEFASENDEEEFVVTVTVEGAPAAAADSAPATHDTGGRLSHLTLFRALRKLRSGTGTSQTKLKGEVEKKLSPKVLEKLKMVMGDMIPYYQQQHLNQSSSTGSLGGLERQAGAVPQAAA